MESEIEEGEFWDFRSRRDSKEDLEWRLGLSGWWRAGGENGGGHEDMNKDGKKKGKWM